ncbi:MAG: hypothetical protein QNJ73_09900 [Gammaproteobacteria bacterium]|nr:hypothetical protein [Gammaproteobacteria bacterium]
MKRTHFLGLCICLIQPFLAATSAAYFVGAICISGGNNSSTLTEIGCSDTRDNITNIVTGEAYANLATGQLRARSSATYLIDPPRGVATSTRASFGDTITVLGDWTGTVPVDVSVRVTGRAVPPNPGATIVSFSMRPSGPGFFINSDLTFALSGPSINATLDINSLTYDSIDVVFTETFNVPNLNPNFLIGPALTVFSSTNFTTAFSQTDFFDTASLSIDLPPGLSFSSESGVFLTAIPIPPALWLFGSALGLLGWLKRRHA